MNTGVWVWPSDQKVQRRMLTKVAGTAHLTAALTAIAKAKEGLSNSELDDALGDNSEWMTLWVIRQLTSLGFIEFKVDLFGGPAKYQLTDLGKTALTAITGQPAQKPVAPPVQPMTKPITPPQASPSPTPKAT